MNEEDLDEIFKLAKLVREDKLQLQEQLNQIREAVKKKQETLRKLYALLR